MESAALAIAQIPAVGIANSVSNPARSASVPPTEPSELFSAPAVHRRNSDRPRVSRNTPTATKRKMAGMFCSARRRWASLDHASEISCLIPLRKDMR